jgi:hypothetical protein
MKAKVRLELQVDLPNSLLNMSDHEVVDIVDQELRDLLYVAVERDSSNEFILNIDSLKVSQYFNISRSFEQIYHDL